MYTFISAGKYHEQIQIEDNSSGHSYEKVFTPFIDDNLRRVVIEDPYIRAHHQVLESLTPSRLLTQC